MNIKTAAYVRYAGILTLISAFAMATVKWTWPALVALFAAGVLDIILVIYKADTITTWIHKLFPKAIDMAIIISLGIFIWAVFGHEMFLPAALGVVVGHLFWNG